MFDRKHNEGEAPSVEVEMAATAALRWRLALTL